MESFPVMHLAEEVARGNLQGEDSRDSSLAVSPLSTHRTNCESLASTGVDSSKPAMSTLFAKVDISDLLAPLEARLFERLDSVEAMVDRRCGALECRVGVLTAAAAATSDAAGFQQQIKVLQAQMEATMGQLQSYMEKESVRIAHLADGLRVCGERQSSLQSNIDEVWRQLKADRQEVLSNYQSLSDTIEPRLRGILDKVDRRCSDLGSLLIDDATAKPEKADVTNGPLLGSPPAPLGRIAMSPILGSRQVPPSPTPSNRHAMVDEAVIAVNRLCSAPLSLQSRSEVASPSHASASTPMPPVPSSPQVQHRTLGPAQPLTPGAGQHESERLGRHSSTPMLPMRMRSADTAQGGSATPSHMGARPAVQPLQRTAAPVQRMASANRGAPHGPDIGRSGGSMRSPPGGGSVVRSYKELPRP